MYSTEEIRSMIDDITPFTYHFSGSVATKDDLPSAEDSSLGEVYLALDTNITYLYTGSTFEPLCDADEIGNDTILEEVIKKTKCDSCGAPLIISKHNKHMLECEYCGSKYPNV